MCSRPTDREEIEDAPGDDSDNGKHGGKHGVSFRMKLAGFLIAVIVLAVLYGQFGEQVSFENLSAQESAVRDFWTRHPVLTYLAAFALYATVTGLSLPGAAAMTLIYGWFFGAVRAAAIVSFASTAGATLAFLLSRYLFRDAIQSRFGERLSGFNQALRREGPFYLFTLRLIPAVPFFVINVVMGLTPMGVGTYWCVSQVGMLPGTFVYCYAGSTVPELEQILDSSRLRADDVRDWSALETVLTEAETDGPATPAGRIRDLLPAATLQRMDDAAGGPDSDAAKSDVIAELNRLLNDPKFYNADAWRNVPLDADTKVSANKHQEASPLEGKELTRLNRRLLEAGLPGVISSPGSILSPQLFLAFVLLGTFPLLMKRIMARLRPRAPPSDS